MNVEELPPKVNQARIVHGTEIPERDEEFREIEAAAAVLVDKLEYSVGRSSLFLS